jgi:hypothetical protein
VANTGIDVRGQSVFHEIRNGGREFNVECQANWFPYPLEERTYVMDVGV